MQAFRTVPVASPESDLPGNTRPTGFKSTGARPGGPIAFAWWVVFYDVDGVPLVGGSASVQWYSVAVDGAEVTTPMIGGPVAVAGLDTESISVGDKLWLWCRALSMDAPVGGVTMRIFLAESAHASPSVAQIQAGLATSSEVAWGTVLHTRLEHDSGLTASQLVPAPAPGNRIEVLAISVNCSEVGDKTAPFALTSSGSAFASGWHLGTGASWATKAVSPESPLWQVTAGQNLGISSTDAFAVLFCEVQYRVVPI